MRGIKKADLPQKLCLSCQRPFTWRKRWRQSWDDVRYCSAGCRKRRQRSSAHSGAVS